MSSSMSASLPASLSANPLSQTDPADLPDPGVLTVRTVPEALAALEQMRGAAVPVAGASWVMRAPVRGQALPRVFVSLHGIDDLHRWQLTPDKLELGPLVTHAQLAQHLSGVPDLRALQQAADSAANPSIRRVATVGGNICAQGFASPDLVPALLALRAQVRVETARETSDLSLSDYLQTRVQLDPAHVLTGIYVHREASLSAHARILMRKAGEYPVANLSMALTLSEAGAIAQARVAVGSVEETPKRWLDLEQRIIGATLGDLDIRSAAQGSLAGFSGRDAADAPGWYRLRMLPVLAQRALDEIKTQSSQET